MNRKSLFLVSLLFVLPGMILPGIMVNAQKTKPQKDAGYLFLGPQDEFTSKSIKKDVVLTAFFQEGVAVSDNTASPWYRASVFAHGSFVKYQDGDKFKEVVFIEATDTDGDQTWSVLWLPDADIKHGEIEIIQGTGKWSGITGKGKTTGLMEKRADGFIMPGYEISWEIDKLNPPFSEDILTREKYEFMDKSLSFHGPHVVLKTREFTNGISLEFNTQSGVLFSRIDPDVVSPRNDATCFDRGQTVKKDGKVLGDVMLLEDTDNEGDVVWLYHIWWYGKGPGIYKFIGGIGKWEGIQGVGVTKGMYKSRSDDHFMLTSELRWNIVK